VPPRTDRGARACVASVEASRGRMHAQDQVARCTLAWPASGHASRATTSEMFASPVSPGKRPGAVGRSGCWPPSSKPSLRVARCQTDTQRPSPHRTLSVCGHAQSPAEKPSTGAQGKPRRYARPRSAIQRSKMPRAVRRAGATGCRAMASLHRRAEGPSAASCLSCAR
jgi:hypothetical protein